MKRILFLALLLIFAGMLYDSVVPESPVPQPPQDETVGYDSEIIFTVKTDQGIETVCMDSYLPGVLAGEMPASFETQALMAQAVAARTYILHRIENGSANHPDADICNNPACCKAYVRTETMQKNWGDRYSAYYEKISAAAAHTDGQYLTYEGELIEAVFHASSAGATEASSSIWNARPYLVSVDSPETEADVPNYISQVQFSADLLKQQLLSAEPSLSFPPNPGTWLTEISRNESGRVQSATICGSTFSGAQLRSMLGLRSTSFTADYENGIFTFTVTGHGHGVGMSQYGANVFAKQGLQYEQILAHYYPNTQLTSAAG